MKFIKRHKYFLTILLIIILTILAIINKDKLIKQNNQEFVINNITKEDEEDSFGPIYVDIKGAIANPGVYEVDDETIVNEVIEKAGGLLEEADTSIINLARRVEDGDLIIIYTKEEVANSNILEKETVIKVIDQECVCPNIQNEGCMNDEIEETITNANEEQSGIININTASKEELMTISGIGDAKAEAIIKYREENDGFDTIEDIMNVSGIGEALFNQIKDYITV